MDLDGRLYVYDVALRTAFRGQRRRDGVLIRGERGWGEFAPFADYDDAASVAWLASALEAANGLWPEPLRTVIPVNVTIPAVDPMVARRLVAESGGCQTAKVKVAEVGDTLDDEIARLEAVRDALGPGGQVRIDVNGRWSLDEALTKLPVLDRAAGGLEYVEQPCAEVHDLAQLRRRVAIPVAADESVRRAADPLAVARAEAADILVLKVAPLGGVRACLRLAEDAGLPVVVSSALETSVGLAAGLALAAALPELPYACGLATAQLLADDVLESQKPRNGTLQAGAVVPDPDRLAAVGAGPALAVDWRARLDRVDEIARSQP